MKYDPSLNLSEYGRNSTSQVARQADVYHLTVLVIFPTEEKKKTGENQMKF